MRISAPPGRFSVYRSPGLLQGFRRERPRAVRKANLPSGTSRFCKALPISWEWRSSVNATSITLSWTASLDNVGVAGYGVYSNGTSVASTALTVYTFSGLTCGTSYVLAVDAYDAAGNRSPMSNVATGRAPCSGPFIEFECYNPPFCY